MCRFTTLAVIVFASSLATADDHMMSREMQNYLDWQQRYAAAESEREAPDTAAVLPHQQHDLRGLIDQTFEQDIMRIHEEGFNEDASLQWLVLADTEPAVDLEAAPKPDEPFNDGQDPTRPLWRLDLRYKYEKINGNTDAHITTFRVDMPVALNPEQGIPGGAIYTRVDIPVANTDQVGLDNPNGDRETEVTDTLMQNIYLPPFAWVKENTPFDAIAVGVQWGFPTGGGDFVSREKFAIAPVFAWKWDLDGPETFIAPVWRWRTSFRDVSNGENRDDVDELTLQPLLSISTKKWGWPIDFLTFYETQEIKLNFEGGATKGSGDVFIPFEVEVGKVVGKTVYSLDFATPIYKSDGFDTYDWFFEFRVGFLF